MNWPQMRERYEGSIADCVTREDVAYLIREMISS